MRGRVVAEGRKLTGDQGLLGTVGAASGRERRLARVFAAGGRSYGLGWTSAYFSTKARSMT